MPRRLPAIHDPLRNAQWARTYSGHAALCHQLPPSVALISRQRVSRQRRVSALVASGILRRWRLPVVHLTLRLGEL
jgi:hypothetical protein